MKSMCKVISTIEAHSKSSVKAEIVTPKAGSFSFRSQTKVRLQLPWGSPPPSYSLTLFCFFVSIFCYGSLSLLVSFFRKVVSFRKGRNLG